MTKEHRAIPERRELRGKASVNGNKLVGSAIVYNSPSSPIRDKQGREFIEFIAPGAFSESLATGRSATEDRPITFVWGHEDRAEYGSVGTNLVLVDTGKTVDFEMDILTEARLLKEAVASGETDMSFEFYTYQDSWDGNKRTIVKGDLVHISLVKTGAYSQAYAELRQQEADQSWKLKNWLLKKKLNRRAR